ncbi:MAG: (2Fe-2S) ferredoxin domain-containing protein [Candidatus Margulisbacteria bacterium]|jgi:NADP-reducing hydrogenase subunit HndB|nr:(2Fe-2S) ferredoxin domain-containing protein [Candidatus Margulisiibacteriota bacterium]
MAKLTLADLKQIRAQQKAAMNKRETDGKEIQLVIGMATCGIAAGARDTLKAFMAEIEAQNLNNVLVRQTGCMGFCANEPTVEVIMPGMPTVIYGRVDAAVAKKIVSSHILNKTLVNEHVFDRPAADNILKQEAV